MLQSIGEPNAAAILVKSFMFYITMNLDVFIYCYAGEYLSAKVSVFIDFHNAQVYLVFFFFRII